MANYRARNYNKSPSRKQAYRKKTSRDAIYQTYLRKFKAKKKHMQEKLGQPMADEGMNLINPKKWRKTGALTKTQFFAERARYINEAKRLGKKHFKATEAIINDQAYQLSWKQARAIYASAGENIKEAVEDIDYYQTMELIRQGQILSKLQVSIRGVDEEGWFESIQKFREQRRTELEMKKDKYGNPLYDQHQINQILRDEVKELYYGPLYKK